MRVHVVVDVLLHLGLRGETPSAVGHGTAERPVALMGARVLVQDGLLPEILAALLALVRLLAGVYPQMLIENGALPEVAAAVDAAVGLLVRVDAQVLGQMGLLSEPLAALRARIRPRLDVYAAVLQQRGFLLEFLLADGTTHVKGHTGGATVLDDVGQAFAVGTGAALLLDVLEGAEGGATSASTGRTEDRMVATFRVLEVGWVLAGGAVAGRRAERTRLRVRVAERRGDLLLTLLRWERHVLGPQGRRHPVLEDQVRTHV